MKRAIIYAMLAIIAFACCGPGRSDAERVVMVSIEPLRWAASQVVDSTVTVTTLVPRGGNPETYEPTAIEMMQLAKADIFFHTGGLGFELACLDRMHANAPETQFVCVGQQPSTSNHQPHTHHHTHDPHIWLSPRGMQSIIDAMEEAMRPTAKPTHATNTATCVTDTATCATDTATQSDRHGNIKRQTQQHKPTDTSTHHTSPPQSQPQTSNPKPQTSNLTPPTSNPKPQTTHLHNKWVCRADSLLRTVPQGTAFAIYHPSLTQLAADYGLTQVCIEEDGKEPTPLQLAHTIDRCRQAGVRVIFVQQEFDTRSARQIASQIGARVVTINPLGYDWPDEIEKIVKALNTPL